MDTRMNADKHVQKRIHPLMVLEIEKVKKNLGINNDGKASKVLAERINATKYVEKIKSKGKKWLNIETKIRL